MDKGVVRNSINRSMAFLDDTPSDMEIINVRIKDIVPNEGNFYSMSEQYILDLSESIKEFGQLSPIRVIKLDNGAYKLIDGECRYRACKLVGIETIDAIEDDASKSDAELKMTLIQANKQREKTMQDKMKELTELEFLYEQLRKEGKISGIKKRTFTANALSISETSVQNLNSLKRLIPSMLHLFETEILSADRAYEIARVTHTHQHQLFKMYGESIGSLSIIDLKESIKNLSDPPAVIISRSIKSFGTSIKKLTSAFESASANDIDDAIIKEYQELKATLEQLEKYITR